MEAQTKQAAEHLRGVLASVMHVDPATVPRLDAAGKLLLACMPKSGSTWSTRMLAENLSLATERAYFEGGHNEQEIDFVQIAASLDRQVLFVQQHIRASEPTLRLCRAANIKVVVQTRNVLDCLASFHDHILKDSDVAPMFFIKRDWFAALPQSDRFDFLIEHCLPWYVNFLVGWLSFAEGWADMIKFVRYEDLVADPARIVTDIAAWAGFGAPAHPLVTTFDGNTRFNQGRSGRGVSMMSQAQAARALEMFRYYPRELDWEQFAFALPRQ